MSILSALKGTFALKDEQSPDVRLASAPPPPPPPVTMADVTAPPPPPPRAKLTASEEPGFDKHNMDKVDPINDQGDESPAPLEQLVPDQVAETDRSDEAIEAMNEGGDETPYSDLEQSARAPAEQSPEELHQEGMEQYAETINRVNEAVEQSGAEVSAEVDRQAESVIENPDATDQDKGEVTESSTNTKKRMEDAVREMQEENARKIEEAMKEEAEQEPETDKGDKAVEAMNEGGDESPAEAPPEAPEKQGRTVAEILQEEFTNEERADLEALRKNPDRTPDEERRLNELRDKLDVLVFGAPPAPPTKPPAPETTGAKREGSIFEENEDLNQRIEEARKAYEYERDTHREYLGTAKQELIDLLREKMAEMARIRSEATRLGNDLSRLAAEGRIAELKAELSELERPPGWMGRFRQRARETFDKIKATGAGWVGSIGEAGRAAKEKVGGAWERTVKARGFLWERIKGIGGFYEALQWEKLRRGTKEVATEIKEREGTIWTEQTLQEQADLMAMDRGYEKMEPDERKKLLEDIEKTFLAPMRERNEKRINEIVHVSMENYKAKLAKVKRAMTGESAVSEENLARVEARIRERLTEKAQDMHGRHVTDYRRELRRLADPHWNWRLGFAGIQAVLAGLGIGYIGSKIIEGGAATIGGGPTGAETVGTPPIGPETIPPPSSIPPGMEGAVKEQFLKMHQNVWTSVKLLAEQQAGVTLPDAQIMEISKQLLIDNGMYEPEWLMEQAGRSARALPEALELNLTKLPDAMKAAMGILR